MMCLFKNTIGLVCENPLAVDVLTSPKNSWNLHKSTFIQLFLHSEPNWVRKSYFQSDLRFQDCLITRWLPSTSSLEGVERTYSLIFKSNYLKYHKPFAAFFFPFLESTLNDKCSEKKMSLRDQVFFKLLSPKDVLI